MVKRYLILAIEIQLAACGQHEPQSTQYFEANIEEARKVAAVCTDGSQTGAECANADLAI